MKRPKNNRKTKKKKKNKKNKTEKQNWHPRTSINTTKGHTGRSLRIHHESVDPPARAGAGGAWANKQYAMVICVLLVRPRRLHLVTRDEMRTAATRLYEAKVRKPL